MFTIPANCDQLITQNVNKGLLILKCTCHLKNLSYHLQMAESSVNICILYKIYMITGHIMQKLYDHWPYDIKEILVTYVFS